MEAYFSTAHLAVGYNGNILIDDINIKIEKGKILTLIGPNGAGKSTILKTITRHLKRIDGGVFIGGQEVAGWSAKEMAQQVAVVLTDRIRPELMTCAEVVAMGRYPYTNMMGKMTPQDKQVIHDAMSRVHALDLADREFCTLSDGQKQRIMLARAICQEPEIIVLDEPTAYLDIRHKVELLDILRSMAQEKKITVIMSLHEIDLATKISDYMICVKGERISAFGTPEEILRQGSIECLYDMENGSYDLLFGSIELTKPKGKPRIFVVAGGGYGIPCYRALQKKGISFATGVLFGHDVDCQVAKKLSDHVVIATGFEPITQQQEEAAARLLTQCEAVVDAGTPVGNLNRSNERLIQLACQKQIPVISAGDIMGDFHF